MRNFCERRWTSSDSSTSQSPSFIPIKSFLIGTTAGVCGSLAGMGGGFVMIPLMTSPHIIGLSQHAAHGTSLFAVATTGIAGALGYSGQNVDYEAALSIALCGMVSARAGALATSKMSEVALRRALGVFMLSVAPLVPAKQYLIPTTTTEKSAAAVSDDENEQAKTRTSASSPHKEERTWMQRYVIPAGIGSGSGFLAGLFGVGGGAVVVPALSLFTEMSHYKALGTSLCAMVLPAMAGTATHFSKGNVAMNVAPFLASGAFVGAYFGGKLARTIQEDRLKYGFSALMLVLGLRALK